MNEAPCAFATAEPGQHIGENLHSSAGLTPFGRQSNSGIQMPDATASPGPLSNEAQVSCAGAPPLRSPGFLWSPYRECDREPRPPGS